MGQRELILRAIRASSYPLNDDELAQATGIRPRQTVNQICRGLAATGQIIRTVGSGGKLVNSPGAAPSGDNPFVALEADQPAAGSSEEQRSAEAFMLDALGRRLGVVLRPARIVHPTGAKVEVDGADPDQTVLVECWAHQGSAKVAQKYKLMNDAVKLHWIARTLPAIPRRLVLCVSDEAAVKHLRGRSWQGQAIADLGVSIEVVRLPDQVVAAVLEAQKRQYR